MMNEQLEQLLCDYLDGDISADNRKQVEELLAHDPELRRMISDMQAARGMLQKLPVEMAPQQVRDAIIEHIETPTPIRMFAPSRLLRIAAVMLLAMGGSLLIWSIMPQDSRRPIAMEPVAQVTDALVTPPSVAMGEVKKDAQSVAMPKPELYANTRAVMVVRAKDVPTAQREINAFLNSNNISFETNTVRAEADKSEKAATVAEDKESMGGMAAPAVVLTVPAPSTPASMDMAVSRKEGADVDNFPRQRSNAKGGMPITARAGAMQQPADSKVKPEVTPGFIEPQQITMRNVNEDQVRFIRDNVYNMADALRYTVADESPVLANAVQSRSDLQNQSRQQMPYIPPQEQNAIVQQTAKSLEMQKQQTQSLYDLTIVVESIKPLPQAKSPDTLPSSRPR